MPLSYIDGFVARRIELVGQCMLGGRHGIINRLHLARVRVFVRHQGEAERNADWIVRTGLTEANPALCKGVEMQGVGIVVTIHTHRLATQSIAQHDDYVYFTCFAMEPSVMLSRR